MKTRIVVCLFILIALGAIHVLVVHAEDCATPPTSGSASISAVSKICSYPTTMSVQGVQGGNLTIAAGNELFINPGQTIVFGVGNKIDLTAAGASIVNYGTVQQGAICVTDADGDGYPKYAKFAISNPGDDQTATTGACPAGKVPRSTIAIAHSNLADCNDSDPNINILVQCYHDDDGDGAFSTTTASRCTQASCTGPGYSAVQGTDCNDNNANVRFSHTACYADSDLDTYTTSTQVANTTCLDSSSCNTATYATATGDGGTAYLGGTQFTAGKLKDSASGSTDCCDTDANAKPGQTGWFTSPDACGDFNYHCGLTPTPTPEYPSTGAETTCTDIGGSGSCVQSAPGVVGWISSVPACGTTVTNGYIDTVAHAGTCASGVYPTNCSTLSDFAPVTNQQACH